MELKEVTEKLATSITLDKLNQDIEILNNDIEINKQRVQREIMIEEEISKFNEVKAEMLKAKIRENFQLVEFITKGQNKDGSYYETFELAHNGIRYPELNSAMKIQVALDLAYGVQKLKDKFIPILIDNTETVTNLPILDTQVIATRVVKQDNPRIILNNEEV